MAGGPEVGGGSERRPLAAVVGVIFLSGFAARGAAWWVLDEFVERREVAARRGASSTPVGDAAEPALDRTGTGGK